MGNPKPPRGFTLVELAIVIVIAGILAAVAVPIYNNLVDSSKWTEGKTIAGTVRSAIDVSLVENNGWAANLDGLADIAPGAGANPWAGILGLDIGEFTTKYFSATDTVLTTGPSTETRSTATYLITVNGADNGNSVTGAPDGQFRMNQLGVTTGP